MISLKESNGSDSIPFENAGIPAVCIECCDPGGEVTTDNACGSVAPGKIEAAGKLLSAFLNGLDSNDLKELKY